MLSGKRLSPLNSAVVGCTRQSVGAPSILKLYFSTPSRLGRSLASTESGVFQRNTAQLLRHKLINSCSVSISFSGSTLEALDQRVKRALQVRRTKFSLMGRPLD